MQKDQAIFGAYLALITSSDLGRGGTSAEKPERFAGLAKQAALAVDVFEAQVGADEELKLRAERDREEALFKLEQAKAIAEAAEKRAKAAEERAKATEQRAKDALFRLEQAREQPAPQPGPSEPAP